MKPLLTKIAFMVAMAPYLNAATTFDFDGSSPITTTGTALTSSVIMTNAYWETLDDNGDPLAVPGFRQDTLAPVVTGDPSVAGYGSAISGNALDGVGSPLMFTFDAPLDIRNFSVFLDNSSFGNIPQVGGNPAFGTNVLFYDAADTLIGFIPVDQTVSGFSVADLGTFNNVSKVILPSGAFYDNLSFNAQAIPEPTSALMGAFGVLAILTGHRRRTALVGR